MNFDWRKLDLKKSCIFDLTDDIDMIRQCTILRYLTLEDREEYVTDATLYEIAVAMRTFAQIVKDEDLLSELRNIFSNEYAKHDVIYDE